MILSLLLALHSMGFFGVAIVMNSTVDNNWLTHFCQYLSEVV